MDALDEQLAQLKLINSRSLSPKITETGSGSGGGLSSPGQTLLKKVGPAVPPKPVKKNNSPPQVPQSSVVKQTCEPLFSKRLQVVSKQQEPNQSSTVSIGQRKSQHVYSNMKMTLDNPVILDQQLEALEYHKKQMEKKSASKIASYSNGGESEAIGGSVTNNFHVYSNLGTVNSSNSCGIGGKTATVTNPDVVVYSNIRHQSQQSNSIDNRSKDNIVYSNVGFDELPPPPPLDMTPAPINLSIDSSNFEYLHQTSEDELPPPPSPVSSSYSELRRATDHFPQMPQYPIYSSNNDTASVIHHQQQQQQKQSHQQMPRISDSQTGSVVGDVIGGTSNNSLDNDHHLHHHRNQQTYVNTQYQNDYNAYDPSSQSLSNSSSGCYGYGDLSQGSSTYESIYEPINPRPPSQLSSRSNYSLYTSYVNGSQGGSGGSNTPSIVGSNIPSISSSGGGSSGNQSSGIKLPNHKEAEVEALTNLLVHSMETGPDVDNYGICVKCGERVVGESSGCTAMEQIYHITCFTCSQCQINLQGKPFYALEGKPYCEYDYLNTLEKCSVCMKPILERILRATGKPFHPGCFCCVVCGNSLDGIPFTVDATNQNYCIEDFHKKFAPRCCVCREPIMPEPGQEETVRVVALDRSFHFECYKCEDCGLLLSSEAEGRGCYPLDDHVLCKSCNAKRVQALTSRMTTEL